MAAWDTKPEAVEASKSSGKAIACASWGAPAEMPAVGDPWPTRPYAPRAQLAGGSLDYTGKLPSRLLREGGGVDGTEAESSMAEEENRLTIDEEQLFAAVRVGNKQAVESLLRLGVPVDIQDADWCTPLHLAAQKGRDALVPVLLDAGAPVDARAQDDWTALHLVRTRALRF